MKAEKQICFICQTLQTCRRLKGVPYRAQACCICSIRFYLKKPWELNQVRNQKGSISMGATLFLLIGFVCFVGAAYMFIKNETSTAVDAVADANEARAIAITNEKKIHALRLDIKEGDAAFKRLMETLLERDAHGEKLKQKLEWVEMKLSNLPRTAKIEPLTIKQTEPIKVHVVYRQAEKVKVAKPRLATAPKKKAKAKAKKKAKKMSTKNRRQLIKNVKKKVKELSH